MVMTHRIPINPGILPGESHPPGRCGWLWKIPWWVLLPPALMPATVWFVRRLDDGNDEALGLLVLALAAALAWRDRRSLRTSARARTFGAVTLLASVLTIGTLPPLLRAALAVAGTGVWFGLHRRPGALGLLVLSLPVVASLQFYAGYPMRLAAAEGAVRLLELGGIVVARNGVSIEVGGMAIAVDPACSGIRMLWHALAAAMALAAIHRVSWRAALTGGVLAVLLVIPANIARAAWLALDETGRFQATGLGHGGIGLVCFGVVLLPLWWMMAKRARPGEPAGPSALPACRDRVILIASAVLAPVFLIRSPEPGRVAAPAAPVATSFTFNGLTMPLDPLPSSPDELAFARIFPGSLASHRWGDGQVILRHVSKATRKLHPSRDCLRAAGYHTTDAVTVQCADGPEWSRFSATRGDSRLIIHERIVSEQDGSTWTDVPAWYWSALRHPLNGPWRAETVISR